MGTSTASTGSILRKIIELEQQGADLFFGELSFDIDDLMRIDEKRQRLRKHHPPDGHTGQTEIVFHFYAKPFSRSVPANAGNWR